MRKDHKQASDSVVVAGDDSFEKFLLAEYNNIAQAHFNTVSTISSFFRYYILIISLPVSVAVVLVSFSNWTEVIAAPIQNSLPLGISTTAVFLALLAIVGYVINLRCDALLYARTINGIRRYFFDKSSLALGEELRVRVLPRSVAFPRYLEWHYFVCVVLAFAILDSFILCIGWWLICYTKGWSLWWILLPGFAGISLHLWLYVGLARYREFSYLRGHIIGVDIDGVLGKHREQFARILKKERGVDVDPERIVKMPVHECERLGVSEEDERAVFRCPEYWEKMPVYGDASHVLRRLRDVLHYRIFVFSWRPWPNLAEVSSPDYS